MNPEELFRGESETIEYKASVATKSDAYMKTVIAFANGRGGQLLFGVQDVSGEALGLGRKTVFRYMDAVANAIASKCEPRIHPHIYLYEIDRKPIIIVDVPAGAETPYWMTTEGLANGTYVRVGATTRKADRYRIEELILRGQHKFFDETLTDVVVKEKDAQQFCDDLYEYTIRLGGPEAEHRRVGIGQLLSWGLLQEADHHFYASNGYLLLTGQDQKLAETGIQCVVYSGNKRGRIVTRDEFEGPFYVTIESALQFIQDHLGDRDENGEMYRRSNLAQLSVGSFREILANAICHRSYQTPGKIQVAIFDDKIEIVSPGGLDCSLAVEDIENGRSRVRNPAMASAMRYTGMFEGWGNGIPQLFAEAQDRGLPAPIFRARPGDFLARLNAVEVAEDPQGGDDAIPDEIVQVATAAILENAGGAVPIDYESGKPVERIELIRSDDVPPIQQDDRWRADVAMAEALVSAQSALRDEATAAPSGSRDESNRPRGQRQDNQAKASREEPQQKDNGGRQRNAQNGSQQRQNGQQRSQNGQSAKGQNGQQKSQNGQSANGQQKGQNGKSAKGQNGQQKSQNGQSANGQQKGQNVQSANGQQKGQNGKSANGQQKGQNGKSGNGQQKSQNGQPGNGQQKSQNGQSANGQQKSQNQNGQAGSGQKQNGQSVAAQSGQGSQGSEQRRQSGDPASERRSRRTRNRAAERAAELEAALDADEITAAEKPAVQPQPVVEHKPAAEPESAAESQPSAQTASSVQGEPAAQAKPDAQPAPAVPPKPVALPIPPAPAKPKTAAKSKTAAKAKPDSKVTKLRPPKARAQGVAPEERQILDLLRKNPNMTQNDLRDATTLSLAAVRRLIGRLEERKLLKRQGGRRYGEWVVLD